MATLDKGYWTVTEKGKRYATDFVHRGNAETWIVDNYDIDINDPDIQTALGKYKPAEEKITPAGGGFLGIGGKKYPTKEKYGYTYEQREDGQWYKIVK